MGEIINVVKVRPHDESDASCCVHLCQDRSAQLHSFSFFRLKTDDLVVDFLVENNSVDVVEQTEQMSLRDRRQRPYGLKQETETEDNNNNTVKKVKERKKTGRKSKLKQVSVNSPESK